MFENDNFKFIRNWMRINKPILDSVRMIQPLLGATANFKGINDVWTRDFGHLGRISHSSKYLSDRINSPLWGIERSMSSIFAYQSRYQDILQGSFGLASKSALAFDRLETSTRGLAGIYHNLDKGTLSGLKSSPILSTYYVSQALMNSGLKQLNIDVSPLIKYFKATNVLNSVSINWDELTEDSEDETDDIEFNEDGTIVVADQILTVEEIREVFNSCLKESGILDMLEKIKNQQEEALQELREKQIEYFNKLLDKIKELKGSAVARFIRDFLINILAGLVLLVLITPLVEQVTSKTESTIESQIQAEANMDVNRDNNAHGEYQAQVQVPIEVKLNPRLKSPVIAKVKPGTEITVIDANRNWAFIECYNEDSDECVVGWVFIRYTPSFLRLPQDDNKGIGCNE